MDVERRGEGERGGHGEEKARHVLTEPRVIGAFRVKVDDDPARRVAAGRMEYLPFFMQHFINTSHELFIGSGARERESRVPRVISYH